MANLFILHVMIIVKIKINNMINKLYILKSETLKSLYRSHYFLCIGEKKYLDFDTKQFVNIKSKTIVESALWDVGYDIKETQITKDQQKQIDNILKTKKIKKFITSLDRF
jgi:hypothetical protein